MEIPPELVIEGVSRAVAAFLTQPAVGERLIAKVAELQAELLTPTRAAQLLGVSTKTLGRNWRDYGLTKSTALGEAEPRFFRSQVLEAMRNPARLLRGAKQPANVEPMPARRVA